MKKLALCAQAAIFLVPVFAFSMEQVANEQLAEIRGTGNPALDLFTQAAFGLSGLTEAEAVKLWASLTEEEKAAARENLTKSLAGMTDEEKKALDEEMHARFESMTPDERRAMREGMRGSFDSMTTEEKAAAMEMRREMDEIRAATAGDTGPGGPGGRGFGPPGSGGFMGPGPGFSAPLSPRGATEGRKPRRKAREGPHAAPLTHHENGPPKARDAAKQQKRELCARKCGAGGPFFRGVPSPPFRASPEHRFGGKSAKRRGW